MRTLTPAPPPALAFHHAPTVQLQGPVPEDDSTNFMNMDVE